MSSTRSRKRKGHAAVAPEKTGSTGRGAAYRFHSRRPMSDWAGRKKTRRMFHREESINPRVRALSFLWEIRRFSSIKQCPAAQPVPARASALDVLA